MSDDDFLSRWSRRKQAAAVEAKRAREEAAPAPPAEPDTPAEEFDVSTLPPLDSITAITDVRDFLRAGVPADLTRAALRRAWSADPAIRDFVGLAENAWDFTAPDAIPGFGPLDASPEDIRALVDRIISHTSDAASAEQLPKLPEESARPVAQPQVIADGQTVPRQTGDTECGQEGSSDLQDDPRPVDIAAQNDSTGDAEDKPRPRRSHGGALPQ